MLAVITVLSCLDSDGWQEAFLNINMISIAFLNVFSAVFQGGLILIEITKLVSRCKGVHAC